MDRQSSPAPDELERRSAGCRPKTAERRPVGAGFGCVGSPRVGDLLAHAGRPYRIVGSKELWTSAGGRGPVPVAHMPSKVSRR